MALPPEPLDELIAQASAYVRLHVQEVLFEGEPAKLQGGVISDVDLSQPQQVLQVQVDDVVRGALPPRPGTPPSSGAAPTALVVTKPRAPYRLSAGLTVSVLLGEDGGNLAVLSRYGPDSYDEDEVCEAWDMSHTL